MNYPTYFTTRRKKQVHNRWIEKKGAKTGVSQNSYNTRPRHETLDA